ncbi:DUF6493 family protein [Nonomuraea roseoviolacea]|uniref:Secreted protein n=1 Tax=Nonomuraea roseoviolacea subsp. carminata TaxID=160689 RepID=A0ABT1JSI7_9ACTN|nr:DUF6493 family protein [Nonomuraea roseoviolacea]MCP2344715.1 hypothetical protein [Nonomuraea roseoviolacea subsp. carminata]
MTAWNDLYPFIRGGDAARTAWLVAGLGPADRKAVAAEATEHVRKAVRGGQPGWAGEFRHHIRPLMMVGAGCLGGSAAVAAWLFRREFRWRRQDPNDVARILELVRDRPEPWRADLARRVAARVRLPELDHWELAAALVRETGAEPPDNPAFMAGWLNELRAESAAADPLLPVLGPRIFESDALREGFSVAEAMVLDELVRAGLLDRRAVLDGVVGRLLRDGQNGLPVLANLHDWLAPDLDETASRAKDYVRLLPPAPVPVAESAVARLRALDEAGRLEEELFAEAVEALTFRPEPRLLRAVLSWLGATAGPRAAGRADVALRALAEIIGHEALVLQERAVRLAVPLAPVAGEEGRAAIREAAATLPSELRERIAAAYGELPEEDEPAAPSLVAAPAPSLPPPVASPDELARELAGFRGQHDDASAFERLLAGLAEWSHRAPDVLREALRPWWEHPRHSYGQNLDDEAEHLLNRAFLAFAAPEQSRGITSANWPNGSSPHCGPIDRLYRARAFELVAVFERGAGHPVLLATPTTGTGHVDPEVLLDRLALLEASGAEALPADLAQALLRLPRDVDAATAARARTFTSDAGRACAAWMSGDRLPDPEVSCEPYSTSDYWSTKKSVRVTLTLPAVEGLDTVWSHDYPELPNWWALALPSHRELAAAHLLPHLAHAAEAKSGVAAVLGDLAHCAGPAGTATAYALAYGMGHADSASRSSTADALLTLAARGETPVEALGAALTELITDGYLKLNRVSATLDEAARAGGHDVVWAVAARLLAALLPVDGDRPRTGLADLMAAAATAARPAKAQADLPALAAMAGRKGSSRVAQEARRLHRLVALGESVTGG